MTNKNIGFIGAGNMAFAMIKGLVDADYCAKNIYINDIDTQLLQQRHNALGVSIASNLETITQQCGVIILAVKPNQIQDICSQIATLTPNKLPLIISIAAGVSTNNIAKWLENSNTPIIRLMPNTPAILCCGATGAYANKSVQKVHKTFGDMLLKSIGLGVWVEYEDKIDAITALSGSGPAYFFLFLEAMTKQAIVLGLDEKDAYQLATKTAQGAALMATELANNIAECTQLRQQVTSPNGTTEASIKTMQKLEVDIGIQAGMQAAFDRAQELNK